MLPDRRPFPKVSPARSAGRRGKPARTSGATGSASGPGRRALPRDTAGARRRRRHRSRPVARRPPHQRPRIDVAPPVALPAYADMQAGVSAAGGHGAQQPTTPDALAGGHGHVPQRQVRDAPAATGQRHHARAGNFSREGDSPRTGRSDRRARRSRQIDTAMRAGRKGMCAGVEPAQRLTRHGSLPVHDRRALLSGRGRRERDCGSRDPEHPEQELSHGDERPAARSHGGAAPRRCHSGGVETTREAAQSSPSEIDAAR